jgi:pimeloyl-ACP methyl ester carboxylesterase
MAQAQSTTRSIQTPVLNIAYEESGSPQGFPIVLLHGFPDDVHAFDEVAPPLAKAGYRVLVPYLRGYGPTRDFACVSEVCGKSAELRNSRSGFSVVLLHSGVSR